MHLQQKSHPFGWLYEYNATGYVDDGWLFERDEGCFLDLID